MSEEKIVLYPWEPGGESYFITEADLRLHERWGGIFKWAAILGCLAAVIFNITMPFIPVHMIGAMWISAVTLAAIIFQASFCNGKTPNLNPEEDDSVGRRRVEMRWVLFLIGLFLSGIALNDVQYFPELPCKEISIVIALFYTAMPVTLFFTKGRPLEYLRRFKREKN